MTNIILIFGIKLKKNLIMIDLLQFKRNAKSRDLCRLYTDMWNSCKSKEDLVRMASDSNGALYMCESITEKWGLSSEYIKENFEGYCEGQPIKQRGYNSCMLCEYNGTYTNSNTIMLVINSTCDIVLDTKVCEIFVCDNSHINIINNNNNQASIHLFGNSTCNNCIGVEIKKE